MTPRTPRSARILFGATAYGVSMVAGCAIGGVTGLVGALPSGLAVWVGFIGALIGGTSGIVALTAGAVAHCLIRRTSMNYNTRRLLVVTVAAITTSVAVWLILSSKYFYYVPIFTVYAFAVTAISAYVAYPVLERQS